MRPGARRRGGGGGKSRAAQPRHRALPDVERAEKQQGVDEQKKLRPEQARARNYVHALRQHGSGYEHGEEHDPRSHAHFPFG